MAKKDKNSLDGKYVKIGDKVYLVEEEVSAPELILDLDNQIAALLPWKVRALQRIEDDYQRQFLELKAKKKEIQKL